MFRKLTTLVLTGLLSIGPAHAGLITHTDYTAGSTITAAAQNSNENAIVNEFNGNVESSNIKDGTIVNADINTSAAIALSKLSLTDAVTFSSITVTSFSASTITVSTLNVTGIVGSTNGGNAFTGNLGEYISSTTVAGVSTNSPTSGQFGDLLSITVTAGDWDIWAIGVSNYNQAANVTETQMGISANSGNSSTGLVPGDTLSYMAGTFNASNTISHQARIRVSISVTTTYYMKYEAAFSGSNPQWRGSIKARRVR